MVKYSNKTILWVVTLMNVLNFIDRGIIPGATNEFTSFIEKSGMHHNESVYLGLLQSAFIVGYAIASGIFGHMVHYYPPFKICLIGMTIWIIAVTLSGLSYYSRQYVFLFMARMLSGVAEASFQCSIPPWISKYATPEEKGTWMSIFFTAIPVGTAIGYAFSAAMAESVGWQFSFFFEGAVMLLFFPFLMKIKNHFPCESHRVTRKSREEHNGAGGSNESLLRTNSHEEEVAEIPSIVDEFKSLIFSSVYLLVVAGYAMQTGAVIGVSTFGSAFLMGLDYFNTETESSTVFGILVSIAGIIATPLGGIILDKLAASYMHDRSSNNNNGYTRAPTSNATSPTDKVSAKIEREIYEINNDTTDNTDEDDDDEIILPTIDMSKERATMHSALVVITLVSVAGAIFLCLDYFVHSKVLFIMMIGVGCFFIFMTYSGITMAIMLSVPLQNRAFAMGISTLCIHVFGDVPSPIITGYIKDRLAPGCAGGSSSGESVATSDACRADGEGLRLTMLIVACLLILTVVFFAIAWVEEIRLYRKGLKLDSQKISLLQSDVFETTDDEEHGSGHGVVSKSGENSPNPLGQVTNLRRPVQNDGGRRSPSPTKALFNKTASQTEDSQVSFTANPLTTNISVAAGVEDAQHTPPRAASKANYNFITTPSGSASSSSAGATGAGQQPSTTPMSITSGRGSFTDNAPISTTGSTASVSEATQSLLDSALDDSEETQIFSGTSESLIDNGANPMLSGADADEVCMCSDPNSHIWFLIQMILYVG
jgi:MFS family permease